MSKHSPNYIRMYRRRLGLSQEDVAALLGCGDGSQVSRYERGERIPQIGTLLALSIILRVPVSDLFDYDVRQVEPIIRNRARRLYEQVYEGAVADAEDVRLRTFAELAGGVDDDRL